MQRAVQNASSAEAPSFAVNLQKLGSWRGIRVLAWDGEELYGCRGYQLLRLNSQDIESGKSNWQTVARFQPSWWRTLTARNPLTYRLARDGFHALAIADGETDEQKDSRTLMAAVPGAIVVRGTESDEFRLAHKVLRGTRPLHITAVPSGNIYWGEYFDNRDRTEVHIYASADRGRTWHVAYTFAARAIRHVHNVVYDRYADCLWILTGDEGAECKVLRADRSLRNVEVVLSGNQQARAVAAIPRQDAVYLSTDTPTERNHVLRLDRTGRIEAVAELASSSIFGCRTANALFFSTMAEPSRVNTIREVYLAGSADGSDWHVVASWQKDAWPMHYFQYGTVVLPDGENTTKYLAATTIAVKHDDRVTTLWEVSGNGESQKPDGKVRDQRRTPRAESRAS
jgi:hypothetical protein